MPARHSPLAAELLAIPGIESVLVADNTVTVTAAHQVDWPALGIGNIIRRHIRSGAPIVAPEYFDSLPSEGDLKWAIRDLLDREINPAVGQHGGFVELIDVKKNNVFLRLGGGCQGCGAADVTLKQGIEKRSAASPRPWARSSIPPTTPPAAIRTTPHRNDRWELRVQR